MSDSERDMVGYEWGQELPTLVGERVRLRWLSEEDTGALYGIFGNREVTRYWSWPAYESVDQAAALLAQIQENFRARGLFQWGIERLSSPGVIGTTTLFKLDTTHRRAELGYALAREHWGHGYASEALTTLLRFAFDTLGLHRLEADIDPRNQRSIRLVEQLGFVREGLLRERYHVAGEIQDSAIFGLLQPQWAARSSS